MQERNETAAVAAVAAGAVVVGDGVMVVVVDYVLAAEFADADVDCCSRKLAEKILVVQLLDGE